jgi:hypothetical protein
MSYYPEFMKRLDSNSKSRRYLDDLREAASDFALFGIHDNGDIQRPYARNIRGTGIGGIDSVERAIARAPTVSTQDADLVELPFPTEYAQ